jgi:hypothetical protein
MSRLALLLLRLAGLVALGLVLAGAWLFRRELRRAVQPAVQNLVESADPSSGRPDSAGQVRAGDKVDSLHAWSADSVVLSASELASLLSAGLPSEARQHLDSLQVRLGEGRVTVDARIETAAIGKEQLGPLAGVLDPWEHVSVGGRIVSTGPGKAEWRIDALTLRQITLSRSVSQDLVSRVTGGSRNGVVPFALPRGVTQLRVEPHGVIVYREAEGRR